ncbi:mitochondrial carrier [Nadsonia fulvescens var. elongata DSM 6958]|uniref:Mitochondrial carrier n=1 Tax=Nadsonia fulvescens var. elongata DSM 6958 TaxID=857566 RepID=A0A1E3PEL9_9ASCO|nr:mitochondrial carrier [Nadsonia fulvescens var. elongata DSM 6958]
MTNEEISTSTLTPPVAHPHIHAQADAPQLSAGSNKVVTAVSAGSRALASQLFAFYVRVPVKLFRPARVDYLAPLRAIYPDYHTAPYSFRTHSSPALLAHAVKNHGWKWICSQILPPLIANSAIGAILYGSYLISLPIFKDSNHHGLYTTFDQTFKSGCLAGLIQSLVAAPVDAIFTRYSVNEILHTSAVEEAKSRFTGAPSMIRYGIEKIKQIGPLGVFAGFTLSLVKESLGFGLFFATFEMVKGKWYRNYVNFWYKVKPDHQNDSNESQTINQTKKKSRGIKPFFILLAGILASINLHLVQYPLSKIQKIHLQRLETIDIADLNQKVEQSSSAKPVRRSAVRTFFTVLLSMKLYYRSYHNTYTQINQLRMNKKSTWPRWLYSGFRGHLLTVIPGTSIGLVVFEIMRMRLADELTDDSAIELQAW